jgi:hypothetical protein
MIIEQCPAGTIFLVMFVLSDLSQDPYAGHYYRERKDERFRL